MFYLPPFLTRKFAVGISRSRTAYTHTRPCCAPRTHNNTAQPRRRARRDLKSIHRTRLTPPFSYTDGVTLSPGPLTSLAFFSCFLNVINERCNLTLDHARLSTLTMMHVHASRATVVYGQRASVRDCMCMHLDPKVVVTHPNFTASARIRHYRNVNATRGE